MADSVVTDAVLGADCVVTTVIFVLPLSVVSSAVVCGVVVTDDVVCIEVICGGVVTDIALSCLFVVDTIVSIGVVNPVAMDDVEGVIVVVSVLDAID